MNHPKPARESADAHRIARWHPPVDNYSPLLYNGGNDGRFAPARRTTPPELAIRMSGGPLFWQRCLDAFREELTPQQFNTWIRPLALETHGRRLPAARAQPVRAAVGEGALPRPDRRARGRRPRSSRCRSPWLSPTARWTPRGACAAARAPAPVAPPPAGRRAALRPHESRRRCRGAHEQTSLNPSFTFATFVTGKANQLARAAGMQVAEHPTSYNPLFVYGGVGLGKTHLIQAIGNHILQRDAGGEDPLHPRRDLRLRRRPRLPAQGLRRFQALLPLARPAADRRHPVLQRQEPHAGGVLLPVQHADRGAQAGRHHLRHVPEGDLGHRGAADLALRLGPHRRARAAGTRDARRHPAVQGRRHGGSSSTSRSRSSSPSTSARTCANSRAR